jgi:hypothetical protein
VRQSVQPNLFVFHSGGTKHQKKMEMAKPLSPWLFCYMWSVMVTECILLLVFWKPEKCNQVNLQLLVLLSTIFVLIPLAVFTATHLHVPVTEQQQRLVGNGERWWCRQTTLAVCFAATAVIFLFVDLAILLEGWQCIKQQQQPGEQLTAVFGIHALNICWQTGILIAGLLKVCPASEHSVALP